VESVLIAKVKIVLFVGGIDFITEGKQQLIMG